MTIYYLYPSQTVFYVRLDGGRRLISIGLQLPILSSTVKLDFKNCQDKNQLWFENQIANDQVNKVSFKDRQDKNNMTLRTKMAVTKNVLKVKFDCTWIVSDTLSNLRPEISLSPKIFLTVGYYPESIPKVSRYHTDSLAIILAILLTMGLWIIQSHGFFLSKHQLV